MKDLCNSSNPNNEHFCEVCRERCGNTLALDLTDALLVTFLVVAAYLVVRGIIMDLKQ